VELFVDYEFVSSLNIRFDDTEAGGSRGKPVADPAALTGQGGQEMVFQVGCGWEENGRWQFKCFTAAHEDVSSECAMWKQFLSFLKQKGVVGRGRDGSLPARDAVLYHWSPAEVGQSLRAAERTGLAELCRLPWVDLQDAFHEGPIGLPGAWDFGLKSVSKALGKVSKAYAVEYPAQLADGLSAMVLAWEAYERSEPLESAEMRLIERYLEIDCKSLWQVLRWLRANTAAPALKADLALSHPPVVAGCHWYRSRPDSRQGADRQGGAGRGFWWPPCGS
jgi:hypothetical protein